MTNKQRKRAPQCESWVDDSVRTIHGGTRRCRARASYLFDWGPDGSEPRCWRHASPYLSAGALPPGLTIARWNPALADSGWLWSI